MYIFNGNETTTTASVTYFLKRKNICKFPLAFLFLLQELGSARARLSSYDLRRVDWSCLRSSQEIPLFTRRQMVGNCNKLWNMITNLNYSDLLWWYSGAAATLKLTKTKNYGRSEEAKKRHPKKKYTNLQASYIEPKQAGKL